MSDLAIPPGFNIGRLAPPAGDVAWLHRWALRVRPQCVLEFGAGITTLALQDAKPGLHVALEDHPPSAAAVAVACPDVHLVTDSLNSVPTLPYDAVLIDSSALMVPVGTDGIYRVEATQFAETKALPGAWFIVHDWNPGRGYTGEGPKRYLEAMGYTLIEKYLSTRGWGVYRRLAVPADVAERRAKWEEFRAGLRR